MEPTGRDDADRGDAAPTAAPSPLARWLAFGSIVLAGAAGGFIGWAFVDLQCDDGCPVAAGLAGLGGAMLAAVGVGIVAVLALRAMSEWESGGRDGTSGDRRGRGPSGEGRRSPRVR